jgi:hypothetical protein
MREGGNAAGLVPETLGELLVVCVLVSQDLKRYVPLEDLVVGQVTWAMPPLPRRHSTTYRLSTNARCIVECILPTRVSSRNFKGSFGPTTAPP